MKPVDWAMTRRCEGATGDTVENPSAAGQAAGDVRDSSSLVLFGAGELGRRTLAGLRRLGVEPECFADNRPALWGRQVDGLRVVSPPEAARSLGEQCRFVVTVFNGSAVRRQLSDLGCRWIEHFAVLYRQHPGEFLPFGGITSPAAASDDAQEAVDLWADAPSRREYLAQLAWRSSLDSKSLDPPRPVSQQYFPADLVAFDAGEVFVDGGAFDGDTLRAFLARWTGGFQAYRAFEPDPASYARLLGFVDSLDPAIGRRIQVRNWALGGQSRQVNFEARGTAASAIDARGDQAVTCVALDDLGEAAGPPPSYVKLDVEGAEREVLEGGRQLLTRHRPVLSVCLYHRPADLWEIPLFLRSLGDHYRLFLRRYAEDCWELVCYAIPEERLLVPGRSRKRVRT
jgi:FkbM family methyltransferase